MLAWAVPPEAAEAVLGWAVPPEVAEVVRRTAPPGDRRSRALNRATGGAQALR